MLEEHNYLYSLLAGEGLLDNFENVYIPRVPRSRHSLVVEEKNDELKDVEKE
jgi:hypothetical protein